MASLAQLKDDFDDGTLSANWTQWAGGDVVEGSGVATLTSTTGASYRGMESTSSYDLTGSYSHVEVPNILSGLNDEGTFMQVVLDSNNYLTLFVYHGTLTANKNVASSISTVATTAYSTSLHRWWRIRESGGVIYYDHSADGASWNNFTSTTISWNITAVKPSLFIGTDSANGGTDTATFDNYNRPRRNYPGNLQKRLSVGVMSMAERAA